MINTILGTKLKMTSTYDSRGHRVGATILRVSPNYITQVKTVEKDGYSAFQLGVGSKKSVKKAQVGHAKKAGLDKKIRWFREIRVKGEGESVKGEIENLKPGTEVTLAQVFSVGDALKVTGTSKGKGFQGGVKRYNFRGGPKTHGQSDRHRAPGSIGSGTTPGRVYKGKKMAGHMGVERVSYKGLEVVEVDRENNLITIKGGIPGSVGGLVILEKQGRIKGYTPPPEEKPSEEETEEKSAEDNSDESKQEKTETPADSVKEEAKKEQKENAI